MNRFFKNLIYPLITSLFTALIVLAILKVGFNTKFFNPPQTSIKTLAVQGSGEITQTPDTADINFGVTNTTPTVVDAQKQTNATIAKILADFKNLGINSKDITTSNYTIYPQYNYGVNSQVPNSYSVTQNIDVKVTPIDKAGEAIDVATKAGANMLGTINFTFSTQTQSNLEEKARIIAINDAKKKAEDEAAATGLKLGKIINIQETDNNIVPIIHPGVLLQTQNTPTDSTQLPPGQSTVSKNVTVTFEIL